MTFKPTTIRAKLKAPYPAFGGKAKVAPLIWARLGDVSNYIEGFAFSAAVLLGRPTEPKIETINDANHFVANFWRAVAADPGAVVDACDHPVNECDLHARHRWLVQSPEARESLSRVKAEPDYFDARIAGWWAWGACCWIGSGWCDTGELRSDGSPREKSPSMEWCQSGGKGVNGIVTTSDQSKRPRVPSSVGGYLPGVLNGPTEKRPQLNTGNSHHGRGINGEAKGLGGSADHRPQLADAYSRGRGVHGNDSAGTCAQRRAWLLDWFGRLRDRLRTVRVCCGDWERVCGSPSVTTRLGVTGLMLDPPYAVNLDRLRLWIAHLLGLGPEPPASGKGDTSRAAHLYANDRTHDVDKLVARVHVYCRERGADPLMRIALCGYEGEHEDLEALGWSVVAWTASGGYGNRSAKGRANRARERIWFSPHCVDPEQSRPSLFDYFDGANP